MDEGFGYWLSGLIDGEGSFVIRRHRIAHGCRFKINMRDDDLEILTFVRDKTNLGTISRRPAVSSSRPQVVWELSSQGNCIGLISILDQFPLRTRKLSDYRIWREAVLYWVGSADGKRHSDARQERLAQYKVRLESERLYKE